MIADAHGMKALGVHRPERFVVARSTRHSCGKGTQLLAQIVEREKASW